MVTPTPMMMMENDKMDDTTWNSLKIEIEEYLNKKHNGFEAHYFPILTYSKK